MERQEQIHPYELFPRDYLYRGITRRQFFDSVKAELLIFARNEGGSKIPDLGIMKDDELFDLIPRILPKTKLIPEDSAVWAIPPGFTQRICLFEIEPNTLHVFNQINGYNKLIDIARSLSLYSGMTINRAFLFTRGFFLTLVKLHVCLPVNDPRFG
jgi:hypothetical protein